MSIAKSLFKDTYYFAGLICIVVSLFIYSYPLLFSFPEKEHDALFILNYVITVGYFFSLVFSRSVRSPERKLDYRVLLLILFLISAYSVNREISVFQKSVHWLSALLVLSCSNYIIFSVFGKLPSWLRHLSSGISGVSFVLFAYLAIYLLPVYPLGLLGLVALGISMHVFVPVLFAVNTIYIIARSSSNQQKVWYSFLAGILATVIFATVFVIRWNSIGNDLDLAYQKDKRKELPAWVEAAQRVPHNYIAEKLLKAGLVYSVPDNGQYDFFWSMPSRNFGEQKKHDPLVMIASFFAGSSAINEADRIRVLKTIFQGRHDAEERLWSGNDLVTSRVTTSVKIWPVCSIAYTEKTITVEQQASEWPSNRPQEAIYTFYLPEGGVVTSLSLWVNEKEEKAILSTRGKADVAYKTIVGGERRDPSIVHWQEGNTVSVRVFPVISGQNRVFKIGITAPLARKHNELLYENIYFEGPDERRAEESIQIDFDQPVELLDQPFFVSKSSLSYSHEGSYAPFWNLSLPDKGLLGCSYSFDNNTYSLVPYHKKLAPAVIDAVYLDINSTWTRSAFEDLLKIKGQRAVYVYDNELIPLNDQNAASLFTKLRQKEFSLFPLYMISNPATSLLVTCGTTLSCSLDDLEETPFMNETKKFLSGRPKIRLFSLDKNLSPYLKSLKEFRVFQYDTGDIKVLEHVLANNVFAEDTEDDTHVIIHKSDIVIEKKKGETPSPGPDHIMRLFAYNHIMQKLGAGLMTNRPVEDELVTEAREAYVVSPVSSLVVLETAADYERFDIHDTGNSLKNASLKSKGAVPEPHEWVLIVLGAGLLLYIRFGSALKWRKA